MELTCKKFLQVGSFFVFGGIALTEYESVMELLPSDGLHGRRKIYTDKPVITAENVVEVVNNALSVHAMNRREIQYLYDYYRGKQDVRCKVKQIRPEINNKITVNRANEIVNFKVSYLLGDPLQYVSRGSDETISAQINLLNEYMYSEDKASKDKEVAEWAHICGVGVRMVLPDKQGEEDGSPACIYTLDPRNAFVIYYSGIGNKPLAGVIQEKDEHGNTRYGVYTKDRYYAVQNDSIVNIPDEKYADGLPGAPHALGSVPIIEYVHNEARMGAFEIVLPLLNAINALESDRLDDIDQFVQSILVFENCEIDNEKMEQLKQNLGLMIKSIGENKSQVYRVDGELSQAGAQTLVDNFDTAVLEITGMPNRNGGSSTSDTGAATIMRDGWYDAEARAKDTEIHFSRSDREALRVALRIYRETGDIDLKLSDIGLKFTRRNYADIQSKAQVLAELLNNSKVHPKLAFQSCGLFVDAEEAYRISMQWYEEQQNKMERTLREEINEEENSSTIQVGRSSNQTVEYESN